MGNENIDWSKIVAGVRRKEAQALNDFVEIGQEPLFRFCLYLTSNRQLAEDICHDAFIKAIQSIDQLKNPNQTLAWMKQIARRLFLDYCKSAAQSKTHIDFDEYSKNETATASEDRTDQQILAMQALQSLDEEERNIVILVDIQGHSYLEVAETLKMKEGTVKSKISRARKKMLDYLGTFSQSQSSIQRKQKSNPT